MNDLADAKEVLGLRAGPITPEMVRDAYRRRAREAHPDRGGTDEEFKRVKWAYDLLKGVRPDGTFRSRGMAGWGAMDPFKGSDGVSPMKKAETKFSQDVIAALEAMGAIIFNVHGHAMQAAGWPDLQVYHPRWTGHLELKVGRNQPTRLQMIRIADLVKRGTPALVLRLREGEGVTAETEVGVVVAKVPENVWKVRRGPDRGRALLGMLELVE